MLDNESKIQIKDENIDLQKQNNKQIQKASFQQGLAINKTQHYTCFQQIFCCKCFYSINQKGVMKLNGQEIWDKFKQNFNIDKKSELIQQSLIVEKKQPDIIKIKSSILNKIKKNKPINPIEVLVQLYDTEGNISLELLKNCRINPDFDPKNIIRNDLEFYIPQLVTYMIFYKCLKNQQLNEFLISLVNISFHFGHLLFWNLNSNSQIINQQSEETLPEVLKIIAIIIEQTSSSYHDSQCISFDLYYKMNQNQSKNMMVEQEKLIVYKQTNQNIKRLKQYQPTFEKSDKSDIFYPFLSTIQFFNDLFVVCDQLSNLKQKPYKVKHDFLQKQLNLINQNLPANVYVPFFKNSLRNFVVLNIVAAESIIFNTKERVPFYICIEIF